jgi:hypothetical protein
VWPWMVLMSPSRGVRTAKQRGESDAR